MPTDPPLPTPDSWRALGFHDVIELGGGLQSRVFAVRSYEGPLAVKLTQLALVERAEVERRAEIVARLSRIDTTVVPPIRIRGILVHPLGEWLASATPLIEGSRPDELTDGETMGACLAHLHHAMRRLPPCELPAVSALKTIAGRSTHLGSSRQLLHGDFSTANLLRTHGGLRILDFDECGYGPVEFDLANTLFMDLFGRWVSGASMDDHRTFRTLFVKGYMSTVDGPFEIELIDPLMDVRVTALREWAVHPSKAPIGIRTSPHDWLGTLLRFTDEWMDPTSRLRAAIR